MRSLLNLTTDSHCCDGFPLLFGRLTPIPTYIHILLFEIPAGLVTHLDAIALTLSRTAIAKDAWRMYNSIDRPAPFLLQPLIALHRARVRMVSPLQLNDSAPWRQRYRCMRLGSVSLAPGNPARGIIQANWNGPQIQVCAWDVPSGELRPLTGKDDTIAYAWIGPDGEHCYFLQDDRGSEVGHIARVPFAGGPALDLTPDLPPYTLRGFDVSRSGNLLAFDAVFDNRYWFYCITLLADGSCSPPRLIFTAADETWACHLSHDGALLAIQSTHRAKHSRRYSTLVFETESAKQIAELWDGVDFSVEPVQFSPLPGDDRLLATSTAQGPIQPLLWNPRTNQRHDLRSPDTTGAVLPHDWSDDGSRLLIETTNDGRTGLFVYDLLEDDLRPLNHLPGTFRGRSGPFHTGTPATFFGPDDTVWAHWNDASHPPRLLSLTQEGPPEPILPVPDCPPGQPWRAVNFPSSDDVDVQAWLGLPPGKEISHGPFPTILHVHGGPSGAVTNAFDPSSQAWLDHGFAYLSVNYRGSTGFGREFQEKINGDVGRWELEDMLAARRWLIEQGIAGPRHVLLEGGSYGGFLTVWALTQKPDLWMGGIAPVAIVDWLMNYTDSSAAMQGWARMIFDGGPGEKADLYRERSPLTHADSIQAPLIIFQGRHDSRATPRQMEFFSRKMQDMAKDFTLIWLDAGHGTNSAATAERMQEEHMKFAYRALGLRASNVD